MSRSVVKAYEDEIATDVNGIPVVLDNQLLVNIKLRGITEAEFNAEMKDDFIDIIAVTLGTPRDLVVASKGPVHWLCGNCTLSATVRSWIVTDMHAWRPLQ
jgi:hypothetical protein